MADAVALLQDLIRFNTVNPPGNERAAQEHVAGLLSGAGLDVALVGRTDERPNLVARLPGTGDGPTLCLLSHVDTVLATASDWKHDPWSGDLADGFVWGRGALDMKSQTAAEVTAVLRLARSGWRGKGDLLLVVVVDEETGGAEGAQWICAEHPELVRCDYLLNEGSGGVIPFGDERVYGVCVGEKGVFRFKVIADGVAGHASMPKMGDNALLKLAPLIAKLASQPAYEMTDIPRAMLDGLGVSADELRERDRCCGSSSSRCWASRSPPRVCARVTRSTSSRRWPRCRSTAVFRPDSVAMPPSAASARSSGWAGPTTPTASSSWSRWRATRRRSTRRSWR